MNFLRVALPVILASALIPSIAQPQGLGLPGPGGCFEDGLEPNTYATPTPLDRTLTQAGVDHERIQAAEMCGGLRNESPAGLGIRDIRGTARPSPPASRHSRPSASSASALRAASATFAPRRASASANPRPIPEEARR